MKVNTPKGRAFCYGDHVDTDVIIPARYLNQQGVEALAHHCMEDLDPTFSSRVAPGDFIVARHNFGCGSSREHAPLAIKGCGVQCVIAVSFSRIFYRNAINIGLAILECEEAALGIEDGDEISVDLGSGLIVNHTRDKSYYARPFPQFMQEIMAAGGLIAYTQQQLALEGGAQ